MKFLRAIADWLEVHWVAPAYSGWLLLGLGIFFFGAATNTMAGWLYVISGMMVALAVIGALLPGRSLRGIDIMRSHIFPISAGDPLVLEVKLYNRTGQPKTLLQVEDLLPASLVDESSQVAIEALPPQETYHWVREQPTQRRGIYHWDTVHLRTASPLGLFWCRRSRSLPARAVVYPQVLPLSHCPLVDESGQETQIPVQNYYTAQGATEGVTRTLRPYRWGDPIRLVHWRTSARYGELRVRELELFTGGQELVITLDSGHSWQEDNFEQAVIAAASLYFYALRQGRTVSLWTAGTGMVRSDRVVLEVLAAVLSGEAQTRDIPPNVPLVWLTEQADSLPQLPRGSRWLLWSGSGSGSNQPTLAFPGKVIQRDRALQLQLQEPLT
jgi:uncharacterized protein (DUF58 family)